HPQDVIAAATARWNSSARGLMIVGGIGCVAGIGLAIGAPESTPASSVRVVRAMAPAGPSEGAPTAPPWTYLIAAGLVFYCGLRVMCVVRYGPVCWRAFSVWMLYGAGSEPAPGIYRPTGWIGPARVRQALFAALVIANVLLFRMPAALDPFLTAVAGRPA